MLTGPPHLRLQNPKLHDIFYDEFLEAIQVHLDMKCMSLGISTQN